MRNIELVDMPDNETVFVEIKKDGEVERIRNELNQMHQVYIIIVIFVIFNYPERVAAS
jgi:hypothetical protein